MTDPKDRTNPNAEDKFTWKPGDVRWTKKPSVAQRLAARQAAKRKPAPKP